MAATRIDEKTNAEPIALPTKTNHDGTPRSLATIRWQKFLSTANYRDDSQGEPHLSAKSIADTLP